MKKRKRKKNHFVSKCLSKEEQQQIINLFKQYSEDYYYNKLAWNLLYRTYCNECIKVKYFVGSFYSMYNLPFDEYIRRNAQTYYEYCKNNKTFPLRELMPLFKQLRKYGTIWKRIDKSTN